MTTKIDLIIETLLEGVPSENKATMETIFNRIADKTKLENKVGGISLRLSRKVMAFKLPNDNYDVFVNNIIKFSKEALPLFEEPLTINEEAKTLNVMVDEFLARQKAGIY